MLNEIYVQDRVRPGNGREGALGYVRYIAIEHMDVRRDCFSFARHIVRRVTYNPRFTSRIDLIPVDDELRTVRYAVRI